MNPMENDRTCRRWLTLVWFVCVVAGLVTQTRTSPADESIVRQIGVGDGVTDDTSAIQRAVDASIGELHFRAGTYRITRPIVIELAKVGRTSIRGGGVAITGCTIQHTHDAPNSANIRILGRSRPVQQTDEPRHGNITIANNVTHVRSSTFIRVVYYHAGYVISPGSGVSELNAQGDTSVFSRLLQPTDSAGEAMINV
ncbi:glycosyl hydrolase family 28-related protein [Neorhodopirellula pilleata]|uniref:glycosyl hydrolase family 28-related protein n=1 Tax=Neorhodopirellula pilleata TaxID=2714738 RepID=UPI0018CE81FA